MFNNKEEDNIEHFSSLRRKRKGGSGKVLLIIILLIIAIALFVYLASLLTKNSGATSSAPSYGAAAGLNPYPKVGGVFKRR
jgi:flagellar basal body-associated protein FliL